MDEEQSEKTKKPSVRDKIISLFEKRKDNVTIPDGQGGTTQIDHVIVSTWGVFVVETKNYNGWIFGGERDRQWTQKIHGNHSQKFQNPLLQNYKHTESLRSLLELKKNQVKSVVVFMGNCSLKTRNKLPNHVTYPTECVQYIKGRNVAVLGDNQVDAIEAAIRERRLTSGWKTSRQHVSYVKELHHSLSQPAKEVCEVKTAIGNKNSSPPADKGKGRVCPKCGAEMVLRTARRGTHIGNKFWGCGNFPKCRKILEFQG